MKEHPELTAFFEIKEDDPNLVEIKQTKAEAKERKKRFREYIRWLYENNFI